MQLFSGPLKAFHFAVLVAWPPTLYPPRCSHPNPFRYPLQPLLPLGFSGLALYHWPGDLHSLGVRQVPLGSLMYSLPVLHFLLPQFLKPRTGQL